MNFSDKNGYGIVKLFATSLVTTPCTRLKYNILQKEKIERDILLI